MTISCTGSRSSTGRAWLPATLLLLCCADTQSTRRGDRVMVAGYPPAIQAAYRVFAVRCNRCHTLARPLNAHITDPEHWVRYVTRMRRQPTSGISQANAEIILRFLLYYTRERQRAAEAEEHGRPIEHDGRAPASSGQAVAPTPTAEPVAPALPQKPEPTSPAQANGASTPDGVIHGRSP